MAGLLGCFGLLAKVSSTTTSLLCFSLWWIWQRGRTFHVLLGLCEFGLVLWMFYSVQLKLKFVDSGPAWL
jgi:hypothetical protein